MFFLDLPIQATQNNNNNVSDIRMSFHWNLSSDDDDDNNDDINFDDDDNNNKITLRKNTGTHNPTNASLSSLDGGNQATNVVHQQQQKLLPNDDVLKWNESVPQNNAEYDDDDDVDDDDDEEEDVDWEDADGSSNADEEDDRKPAAMTTTTTTHHQELSKDVALLRPITINLDYPENKSSCSVLLDDTNKKSKKRKRRNIFRIESLPNDMQSLLQNLHCTHLLSLTCHSVYVSDLCSQTEIMALAYSLIPDNLLWIQQQPYQHDTSSKKNNNNNNNNNNNKRHAPNSINQSTSCSCPTFIQIRQFVHDWYIPFVHGVEERRRLQQNENRAAGAPVIRRGGGRSRRQHRSRTNHTLRNDTINHSVDTQDPYILLRKFTSYLSTTTDEDPQLSAESSSSTSVLRHSQTRNHLIPLLLVAMVRSMGWRARLVFAMEPMSMDLTVDHPILTSFRNNIFTSTSKKIKKTKQRPNDMIASHHMTDTSTDLSIPMMWVEILGRCIDHTKKRTTTNSYRWFHVDPIHKLINQPESVETLLGQQQQRLQQQHKRTVLSYAISVEHTLVDDSDNMSTQQQRIRVTDVTPRYVQSWIATLRRRATIRTKNCSVEELVRTSWWTKTLHTINDMHRATSNTVNDPIRMDVVDSNQLKLLTTQTMKPMDEMDQLDDLENDELTKSANNETMPTSKAEFKIHPLYVIPSELNKTEVLHPDAKQRVCGVFKGQLIYRRSDVSTMHSAKKWLYIGRKVRDTEASTPIKSQAKRKKPVAKGFQALRSYGVGRTNDGNEERQIEQGSKPLDDDDNEKLYGIWQTDEWSPVYIGPNDDIPTNEFKNIELALLNPGLVHIDQTGMAVVAKKLGIPYVPCLLGFEGHGGNRTPTVRGIVVHVHNEQILREAGVEVQSYEVEQVCNDRRRSILLLWKRLMVGLLTKDRLDREYGNENE